MGAIYRREVGAFFTSSIAYVFLAVFYLAAGYFFFGSSLAMATTDMSNLFSFFCCFSREAPVDVFSFSVCF